MPRVSTGGARVRTALDAASARMSSKASAKGSRGDGDDMRSNHPRGGVAENRHGLAPCTWYRAPGVVGLPVIVGCVAAITDTPLARALHTERGLLSAVHMGGAPHARWCGSVVAAAAVHGYTAVLTS